MTSTPESHSTPATFDAHANPHYIEHLGEVSQQQPCVVNDDITNDKGVLLVKKGTTCSRNIMDQLRDHRLSQPVDNAISLSNCLTAKRIWGDMHQQVETCSDLFSVHETAQFSDPLRHLCLQKDFPRTLLQKLTVLKNRKPDIYQRTLLGTWLAALLAKQAELAPERVFAVFAAGLFRDLGLLHIPAQLLSVTRADAPAQQQRLAAHVLISQALVEQALPNEPAAALAILEHHERPAGSGLPYGKTLQQLSTAGQFLALAEELIEQRLNLPTEPQTLALLQPYVRVHAALFNNDAYRCTARLFSLTPFAPTLAQISQQLDKTRLGNQVMERTLSVCGLLTFLISLHVACESAADNRNRKALLDFIEHALNFFRACGYIDVETIVVLYEAVLSEEKSLSELLEAEQTQLLFLEIGKRVLAMGEKLVADDNTTQQAGSAPVIAQLEQLSEHLNQANYRTILSQPGD